MKRLKAEQADPPSVEALLRERGRALGLIAEIDKLLEARGIRATVRAPRTQRRAASLLLSLLAKGVARSDELAAQTGQSAGAVHQMLHLMVKAGEIHRVKRGVYALGAA